MSGFIQATQVRIAIIATFFLFAAAGRVVPAFADKQTYPTSITQSSNAPVALTTCRFYQGDYVLMAANNAVNRTNTFLSSYVIRWNVYDHAGTMIGQTDQFFSFDSDLAPGDATHADMQPGDMHLSEPVSSIGRATCRLQSAKFEGGKSWVYGRAWGGKLSPIPQAQTNRGDVDATVSRTGAMARLQQTKPQVGLTISNAWNDTLQGSLFVHAALDIRGGDTDATLTPNMLALTMQLANGARKSYGAMTQAAPTYQKINPLGSTTTTAYEVDPKDDLGSIGSVIVPAHATVHVVATFFVGTDVVAEPSANRLVALK